ncbi:MAG: TIM barrel protein [Bacillota bacterium]
MNPSRPQLLVQCSTGALPSICLGERSTPATVAAAVQLLAWDAVELKLEGAWWSPSEFVEAARRLVDAGVSVATVHAPNRFERLLGFPGRTGEALALLQACLATASTAGASTLVLHGWDLRLPGFDPEQMVAGINACAEASGQVTLSIEALPGFTRMLPLIVQACPAVTWTADTKWATVDGGWEKLFGLAGRIDNVHVQSRIEPVGENGVVLGQTEAGYCDVPATLARLAASGCGGAITFEPNGVRPGEAASVHRALRALASALHALPPAP